MPFIQCKFVRVVLVLCGFFVTIPANADWPQWRGPNRDGVVRGVAVPERWPDTLQQEWSVSVGEGIASPVVAGENIYVFTRQNENEVVLCLNLMNGQEKWRSAPYAAPYTPHPAAIDFGKYPRATPTVAGNRIFTLGVSGVLSCLDARTGKLLWRRDYSQEPPSYGASSAPLAAESLCIVHVGAGGVGKGGLTAFDAATGEVRWQYSDGSGPPYGSPIVVNLAGQRQVVTFTSWNMLGVALATGTLLWRVDAPFDGLERCITPVQYKDTIIFAEYKKPLRAVRLVRGDQGV